VNEVQRPTLIHLPYNRSWIASSESNTTANPFSDLQIGLTINAAKSLNIDDPAVSPNHYVKPAVTKPPTLGSQLFKSLA
jgi:hypothetical protein